VTHYPRPYLLFAIVIPVFLVWCEIPLEIMKAISFFELPTLALDQSGSRSVFIVQLDAEILDSSG